MENENTNEWLGYKVMAHCRPNKAHREHNRREPKIVSKEKHIDSRRIHETILDLGTIEEVYHKVFDEAVAEYNATHRADRRIDNYLELIRNDKRRGRHLNKKADGSRKESYELLLQFGRRGNRPDDEIAIKILKEFCAFIPKKYPCIFPYGIYLHADEFSIDSETSAKIYSPAHIHFDFLFLAEKGKGGVKTGLSLQSSLSGALRQMGFVTGNGHTAQQLWEEDLRATLQDFAEERGLKIDRTPGEQHSHKEKPVFQQMMENMRAEKRLHEQEIQIQKEQKELTKNVEAYNNAVQELNSEIKEVYREKDELAKKSQEQKQKEQEQQNKEQELNRQRYELLQREVNANMKESNNDFQKKNNESKSIELSKREKALEDAEVPFKEKEKFLSDQQVKLDKTAKDVDAKLGQLQILQKENEEKTKSLEVMEKELEAAKQDFESSKLKIQAYKEIQNQVENNNLEIDSEINEFQKNRSIDFSTCLNKFVGNVKKIVTAVTTELSWYKAAFKTFWKKRSQDFRKLADLMDRNSCETFSDYNRMYYNGQLDYQLEERKSKRKNNSMNFER